MEEDRPLLPGTSTGSSALRLAVPSSDLPRAQALPANPRPSMVPLGLLPTIGPAGWPRPGWAFSQGTQLPFCPMRSHWLPRPHPLLPSEGLVLRAPCV